MAKIDETQIHAQLRAAADYCSQRFDALDADTLEAQRYRIASLGADKAFAALTGRRDPQIRSAMEHSRVNLQAFDEWCRVTEKRDATFLPERNYTLLLWEERARAEAAPAPVWQAQALATYDELRVVIVDQLGPFAVSDDEDAALAQSVIHVKKERDALAALLARWLRKDGEATLPGETQAALNALRPGMSAYA